MLILRFIDLSHLLAFSSPQLDFASNIWHPTFFNKLEVKLYQAEQSLSGTSYGITTTKVVKNITHQQNMCLPKRERSKEAKLPSI